MTKREQYINALKTLGFVEVPSLSKKYVTMAAPNGEGKKYFVGKAGAIRRGEKSSASVSIDGQKLLALAEKVISAQSF